MTDTPREPCVNCGNSCYHPRYTEKGKGPHCVVCWDNLDRRSATPINDGGPAFPLGGSFQGDGPEEHYVRPVPGMSLRACLTAQYVTALIPPIYMEYVADNPCEGDSRTHREAIIAHALAFAQETLEAIDMLPGK